MKHYARLDVLLHMTAVCVIGERNRGGNQGFAGRPIARMRISLRSR